MTVPYTFKNAVGTIPLSELDDNFTAVVSTADLAASTGATTVGFTPIGTITSTNVGDALYELDARKTNASALISPIGSLLVGFSPTGTIASTNVQTAIAEINTDLAASTGATLVGFTPTGTISSTTVQTAIAEINTDLAASTGATLVGTIQSGTGAVARTVDAKLKETVSVKDFGAVGNGIADDTVAINLAIDALNAGTMSGLFFPAGSYVISSALNTITRSGISIYGDGPRQSKILQSTNSNTFTLSSTTPATTRLSDFTLENIGIVQSNSAPTSGVALTLIRVDRSYFSNIDIRNVFSAISILGGADIHFSNMTITSAFTWSALAVGSTLLNITYDSYANEVPGELFFDNFNIKGYSSYNGPCYLNYCVVIHCGDGVFFTGGHLGFSYYAPIFITPLAVSGKNIQNIEFSNVYADGNGGGYTSSSCVEISGSTVPIVSGIKFDGCTIKNFDGNGINIDDISAANIRVDDCEISNIGSYGIAAIGVDNIIINSSVITQCNLNNNSSDGISLAAVNGAIINANIIESVTYQYPRGLAINNTSSDIIVSNNLMKNNVTDFLCGSNSQIKFTGNLKYGSVPTVVCSDGFLPPLGYSFVVVTGNTNFSNISGILIPGYEVTFQFTGTPTGNDGVGNIKLTGAFAATAGSTLTMISDGTNWIEKARAII